jgi:hypothetical protein
MKLEDKIGTITSILCLCIAPIIDVFTENRFLSVGIFILGIFIYGVFYFRSLKK